MENKTISYLNSRMWYRFLKVVFVMIFFVVLFFWNMLIFTNQLSSDYNIATGTYIFNPLESICFFFIGNFVILFIFEFTRRAFYYIVLGNFRPKK